MAAEAQKLWATNQNLNGDCLILEESNENLAYRRPERHASD